MSKFIKFSGSIVLCVFFSTQALTLETEAVTDEHNQGVSISREQSTQILWMNEQKRLEADIGMEVMNRLAVANDRIVNVFGDDGAFVAQTDDNTGQVFIKSTPENLQKPLSMTIITENGATQDLTLNLRQTKAATIILKSPYKNKHALEEGVLPGNLPPITSLQEQEIQVLRKAVLGELPKAGGKYVAPKRKSHFLKIKHQMRLQAGNLWVDVFELKNITQEPQVLLEKTFYQTGDRAIALSAQTLAPKEQALLYALVEY
jgi:type-F conjugative transfer system secretin TraK